MMKKKKSQEEKNHNYKLNTVNVQKKRKDIERKKETLCGQRKLIRAHS